MATAATFEVRCARIRTRLPAVSEITSQRGRRVAKERVERDEEDLVRLYLTDIGQYPLLTKDDEVRLPHQNEQGNASREELVNGGKDLTPTKKRELRRTSRQGDDAQRTFVQSNLR